MSRSLPYATNRGQIWCVAPFSHRHWDRDGEQNEELAELDYMDLDLGPVHSLPEDDYCVLWNINNINK